MLQFSKRGFDYVKVDWCGGDKEGLDAKSTYRAIIDAAAKAAAATGRPLTLSVCDWGKQDPWNWGAGMAALWRTNTDIIFHGNSPSWDSMLANFDTNAHPSAQHTGYYNDPDMLMVGLDGFTAAQNRSHMNLWAIPGAPLLNVRADATGTNVVDIAYTNGANAARTAVLQVNGQQATTVSFPPTGSWTAPGTVSVEVSLARGSSNSLTFSNSAAWTPDFDAIEVRPLPGANGAQWPATGYYGGCRRPYQLPGFQGPGPFRVTRS
ncbi:hypothetical protein [Streptomyces sp. NPDC001415]